MGINDDYWRTYDECLDKIRDEGATVADVIRICGDYYGRSSGEAFFPGGADRDLLGVLTERGDWRVTWLAAYYHYKVADREGTVLEYVEGDLYIIQPRARTS